jgi:hypothetical protein
MPTYAKSHPAMGEYVVLVASIHISTVSTTTTININMIKIIPIIDSTKHLWLVKTLRLKRH